jgi:lysosomal alpha-mannosidase
MGFDGLLFGKFDYRDHEHRVDTKTMELLWKGSVNLGQYKYTCNK